MRSESPINKGANVMTITAITEYKTEKGKARLVEIDETGLLYICVLEIIEGLHKGERLTVTDEELAVA